MRTGGGGFSVFLVILFVLIAVATFGYLQKTGRLAEYKINMFSSIGTDELVLDEEIDVSEEEDLSIGVVGGEVVDEEEQEQKEEDQEDIYILPSGGKEYRETAGRGDGITHLARRALKSYLAENSPELTSEHKIFIEDYVQNRIGDRDLEVGETITISEDLIVEGINKAQSLGAGELENLKNFTEIVWEVGFRL